MMDKQMDRQMWDNKMPLSLRGGVGVVPGCGEGGQ